MPRRNPLSTPINFPEAARQYGFKRDLKFVKRMFKKDSVYTDYFKRRNFTVRRK